MTATSVKTTPEMLLEEINAIGIQIETCGDKLRLRPRSRVTPELAEQLREHKSGILQLLRLSVLTRDQREAWEERVAICVFDGELNEERAEAVAWRQVAEGG
jgi:hypothetical protein